MSPSAIHHPPPRVLLLEPHADTRELYQLWLTQHGFAVTVAPAADQALAAARAAVPDVVLLEPIAADGGLPLIRALRRDPSCRDAVLVVVTTHAGDGLRRDALEAGADACLLKPCEIGRLGQAIAQGSRDRLRLVAPDPYRPAVAHPRLHQAARRYRAIRERLDAGPARPVLD